MEPSRSLVNFEILKAKLALFPMEIGSSGGFVPSTNLMCKRKAASDLTGIPGATKYKKNFQSDRQEKLLKFPNFTFPSSQATAFERSESESSGKMCAEVPEACQKLNEKIQNSGDKDSHTQESLFFAQGHRGLKLKEPSSGSTEGSRNFEHIGSSRFTIYNKVSAERNMEDTSLSAKDKSTSGANYVTSSKDHNKHTGSATHNKMKSFAEVGMPWKDAPSVDANKQLVSLLAASCSVATSSRTPKVHPLIQFYDAEQPLQKSYVSEDDHCDQRWHKRLKLASNSHGNAWKVFNSSTNQAEESDSRNHGKEPILCDESNEGHKEEAVTGSGPSGDDDTTEGDAVLSHSWIKRFTRNGLDKKQFPSISAMAVVGRTMNGNGSFEPQRKGSITLWSTNAL